MDQPFEKHPDLTDHIQRMASTGHVGSPSEWNAFLSCLNQALSKPKMEICVDLPFPSPEFAELWIAWKQYKKDEFRCTFKSDKSELAQLKMLVNLSRNNEQVAMKIIHQSIGCHYQGLFELKNGNGKKQDNSQPVYHQPIKVH